MLLNLIQVELYLSDVICNQFLKIALFQTFEKKRLVYSDNEKHKLLHKLSEQSLRRLRKYNIRKEMHTYIFTNCE